MDKKQRLEIIITASLIPVLILVWLNNIKFFKKKKAQEVNIVSPPAHKDTGIGTTADIKKPQSLAEKSLGWARDPFSGKIYASVSAKDAKPSLKLTGIIWDTNNPLAMINGRVVKKGDYVGITRIVEIKHDRVILNDGSLDFELKLQ